MIQNLQLKNNTLKPACISTHLDDQLTINRSWRKWIKNIRQFLLERGTRQIQAWMVGRQNIPQHQFFEIGFINLQPKCIKWIRMKDLKGLEGASSTVLNCLLKTMGKMITCQEQEYSFLCWTRRASPHPHCLGHTPQTLRARPELQMMETRCQQQNMKKRMEVSNEFEVRKTSSCAKVRIGLGKSARIVALISVNNNKLRSWYFRSEFLVGGGLGHLSFNGGIGGETQKLRIASRSWGVIVFEVLNRLDNGELLVNIKRARSEWKPTHFGFCSYLLNPFCFPHETNKPAC